MTVFDPVVPRIGPKCLEAQKIIKVGCTSLRLKGVVSNSQIQDTVLRYLRLLCGIACCNPVPPARVVSCLAISQCKCCPFSCRASVTDDHLGGTWVDDPLERNAMLEVLRLVDRQDAWPTNNAQETLKAQWGIKS